MSETTTEKKCLECGARMQGLLCVRCGNFPHACICNPVMADGRKAFEHLNETHLTVYAVGLQIAERITSKNV